jgi:hypothetical protein
VRAAVVLSYVAAALLAVTPLVPAFDNPFASQLSEHRVVFRFSWLDAARASAVIDDRLHRRAVSDPDDAAVVGWLLHPVGPVAPIVAEGPPGLDGVSEIVGLVVIAAVAVALAATRCARWQWIPALLLFGGCVRTYWVAWRSAREVIACLPGGATRRRCGRSSCRNPWVLAGGAVLALAGATWLARRAPPVAAWRA